MPLLLQYMNLSTGCKMKTLSGISAPGLPNNSNTAIAFMPGRLQGLENFAWKDFLQTPSYVLNDARYRRSWPKQDLVQQNKRNVVMITFGTGVGGAILINGKPYQGAFNKAGHVGHIVINDDGDPDITGMPGSLEDAVGNATIAQRSKGKFTSTQAMLDAMHDGDAFAKQSMALLRCANWRLV